MFRLIKLGFYALLGYALYELYQGMSQEEGQGNRGGRRSQGRPQNMTGRGEGMRVESEEPSGMSAPHAVGRGVIS